MLPKIKKRLKSFILEEEGRISKQSALKIGSVLLLSAVGSSSDVLGGCGCGCSAPVGGGGCPPTGGGGGGGGGGGCGCTTGGTYCLLNDSLVLVPGNKLIKIQYLKERNTVSSVDIKNDIIKATRITKIIKQHLRHFFYVINEGLFITNDHPVLVLRNFQLNWVKVENLMIGDLIKSLDGYITVKSILKILKPAFTVYMETESGSFIVKGASDYYVVKSNYMPAEFEITDLSNDKLLISK